MGEEEYIKGKKGKKSGGEEEGEEENEGILIIKKKPGNGGISRGRGDAPMLWGKETEGRTDQFEAKALPPSSELDLQNNQMIGLSASTPQAKPESESGGNVNVDGSTGKTSWRRRLAPHHRDAVKNYFQSDSPKTTNTKK
ncbi:MAG: hypothetical protein ACKVS6_06180 [Planctomycetota bacterium]